MITGRHAPPAVLAAAAFAFALVAATAHAQQITVGTGGSVSSLVDLPVDVPLVVDMSGRPERLGSVTMSLRWNPAVLRFEGGSSGTFGALVVNEDSVTQGLLRLAGVNPAGVAGRVVVGVSRFRPIAADTTSLVVQVTELSAAGTFASLLPFHVVQSGSYCPALGRYGDPTGNGAINSQDALAVLSFAVGLPVPGVQIQLGDVDASGTISTRDALIILSYSVGIDVSAFRLNELATGACAAPPPTGFAIVPGAVGTMEPGQEIALQARTSGSGGTVVPVAAVSWSSSDTAVVRVDSIGFTRAVGPGSATVTAIRDNLDTARITLTVVGRRTRHTIDALASGLGVGSPELPFATLEDAEPWLEAGDTLDVRPGRYEGMTLPVSVVILGQIAGDAGPVFVPGSALDAVLSFGPGRYELKRVAIEGSQNVMLSLGAADTVELDSVRISVAVSRCASAAIAGGDVFRLALRRVRLVGDGYANGCADGIWLYGNTGELVLEDVTITDFGGSGVYAYNVDSALVRRSALHGNGGYALWTQALQGYGAGRVAPATSTALVLDSARMSGEFSYGLVYGTQVRSAAILRSRFVGGGYGQSIYLEGWYDGTAYRGYVELRNDSITAPDANWIVAYGLDSLVMDSLRAVNVGDSYIYNVWRVRAERSSFLMSNYYGAALYVSTGGVSQRAIVSVDSVDIRGLGCLCSTGIYSYNASTAVRRLRAADLDEGVYAYYDSNLTVTESVFERVYAGIYAYNYSSAAPALIRNVTMTDVGEGVDLSGHSAVVDSSSFSRGYVGVQLSGAGVDTVRSIAITDYEDGILTGQSAALIEDNTLTRPWGTGIDVYSYYNLDTMLTVVRRNTITCVSNQYPYGMYFSYARAWVEQNTFVNGCYAGIRAYSDTVTRRLTIRDNVIPIPVNASYAAIDVEGNYRFEIVGNLIQGDPAAAAPGAIAVGYYYIRTQYARVDSNTIRFPRFWGVYAENVDTVLIRGNLVEDFRGLYTGGPLGAITVRPEAAAAHTQITGNTLRRSLGNAINVEQYNAATLEVDSNAISQADTAAMRLYTYGVATVRGNNVRNNARVGLLLPYNSGAIHQVRGNAFQGNGLYAIRSDYDSVYAAGNWWGVDGAAPGSGGADAVLGRVNADSALSAEPAVPPLAPPVRVLAAATASSGTMAALARMERVQRPTAPAPVPIGARALRRSGGTPLTLSPPAILADRAVQRARVAEIRAASDSLRRHREASREQARRRRIP